MVTVLDLGNDPGLFNLPGPRCYGIAMYEAQLFLNDNLLNRSCYFNFVGVKNIEKDRIRQRH